MDRIYLSPPFLSGAELRFLRQALDSNWIAPLGPQVDAFEDEIKEIVGVEHAVALSSGTAGLHLALEVLGVGRGDLVICPTLTSSIGSGSWPSPWSRGRRMTGMRPWPSSGAGDSARSSPIA